MPVEIERKFLVKNDTWREQVPAKVQHLRQGYLALTDKAVIRVRTEGSERAWVGIKEHRIGRSHGEYEYSVPVADAHELMALCSGSVIEKMRYCIPLGNHVWEVDDFRGDNTGLVLAEIELDAEDEDFLMPGWAGEEVTDDRRFYNAALSRHPWRELSREFVR